MLNDVVLLNDLADHERLLFQTEMTGRRKDTTIGVLLCLFLGGFGAHRFYMGQTGLGVLYLLFCWTLIPAFVALVECFLMSGRINRHNAAVGGEIVTTSSRRSEQVERAPSPGSLMPATGTGTRLTGVRDDSLLTLGGKDLRAEGRGAAHEGQPRTRSTD